MTEYRVVRNAQTKDVLIKRAKWCKDFFCHFRGLMFTPSIAEDEAVLFVYGRESIVDTSIHMLFMNYPISVIWLNKDFEVVDSLLAKPWRPAYASKRPARYFIEAHPVMLDRIKIGDHLVWDEVVKP